MIEGLIDYGISLRDGCLSTTALCMLQESWTTKNRGLSLMKSVSLCVYV